jgi:SAM-dependent methyltransferase
MNDLTHTQLIRLPLLPDYTVLDVGAGTGRITIPMAKCVKRVTALEPSEKMLSILKATAEKEGVSNIQCINKPLEGFDAGAGVVSFDAVVASFSLFMVDMENALLKMDNLARNSVYLFLSASEWMDKNLQKLACDGEIPVCSDYIYVYNILNDLGIQANVEIWDVLSSESFSSLEDAAEKYASSYRIPSEKMGELKHYLRNLAVDNGKLVSNSKKKVAMIWWTKAQ